MKPINEMTLAECIDRLRELPNGTVDDANVAVMFPSVPWIFDVAEELADRIHQIWEDEQYGLIAITEAHQHLKESIRWVSFGERQPNGSDGDPILVYDKYNGVHKIWQSQIRDYNPSHWRRIDKPEGV